jgi:TolB-like protein/DNA-binding SARP family transcriptional activator/Tfp pilus assembly protein PilF
VKRLKLLGGAFVDADEGGTPVTGRAVQRRRIALLALLVIRQPVGVSRDKLIAYLWPDADSDRGRHLLSDSVYRINQDLGDDTILPAGDELRLDCKSIGCDVLEFETALAVHDFAHAVEVYDGPFLDGFFLSECVELERWIERERDRLSREYLAALEAMAEERGKAGDFAKAVEWWQKAAAQDPYNSRIALRLMQALAAAGNRPGAIQHAQIHGALVRSDFGTEPDKALLEYAERLKQGTDLPARPPSSESTRASESRQSTSREPVPAAAPPPAVPAPEKLSVPLVSFASTAELPTPPLPRRPVPRARAAWMMVGALIGVAALAFVMRPGPSQPSPPSEVAVAAGDTLRSIAVLPFVNLSTDPDNEYFADGITDELTAALDRVDGLRVAARTSAFAFKGKPADIREVAERLRVRSVVEGTVRKDGNRLRIAARLIDANSGYRLWSEEYERQMSDVLAVQAEIARAIATALQQQMAPEHLGQFERDISRDPQAYELYLKGRYEWHRRTKRSLSEARAHFEQAVQRVPSYSRAWSGLGDAYAVSAFYDYVPPREGYPKAEEAARRALELDSTLAAPHATLGYVNLYYHWNWPVAEAEFQRAIRLAPEYSTAHQWFGNFLTAMGRFDEAKTAFQRATESEPLSLIAAAALGWSRYYARAYDEAEQDFVRTLELEPDYELARLWRGQTFDVRGQSDLALTELTRAVELSKRSSLTLAALAHALAVAGQRDSARQVVAEIEGRRAAQYVPPYEIAKVYVALGDTTVALDWFERAYRDRAHSMVFLKVDPQLAGMQRNPRYAALLARVGLK